MGTISALIPIAIGVADKGNLSPMVVIAAVVGGGMFGDNLSMISDTTIAATRTQRVEMRDKFRVNFMIALPAAVITIVLLLIFGRPESAAPLEDLQFDVFKIVHYLTVLILALCGMNEVFFLTLFCGGMSAMVTKNGGINWILEKLRGVIKGGKSAQLGIAALVSACDCATANNTVAIIVAGDMAREVSHEYKVDPRRSASLLDIFSCVFQGLIPYGAQLVVAANLATEYSADGRIFTAPSLVGSMWYCWILALIGILSVYIPFADGLLRRAPWNWEYDRPESAAVAKKQNKKHWRYYYERSELRIYAESHTRQHPEGRKRRADHADL